MYPFNTSDLHSNLHWRNNCTLLVVRTDAGSKPNMHSLIRDFRFAIRQLVKNPGFTLLTMLTLALGIGATTSIFSLVNTVILRPLPFADQDRLMAVNSGGQ